MAEGFESQTGEQQVLGGAGGWKKLGRRWITILTGMLLSNLLLIVLATAGYRETESLPELSDLAIATRSVIGTDSSEPASVSNSETNDHTSTASTASVRTDTQDRTTLAHSIAEPVAEAVDARTSQQIAGSIKQFDFAGLVIINPAATGGTVHYVVDGQVCSLLPAEYRCFDGSKRRKVVFHKGDDLNDAEKSIHEGVFVFGVSQQGWELNPAEKDMSLRLLENCRSAE